MNCLDARRSLLAAPRARSAELDRHVAECAECARLDARLNDLDARITDAALVPVPDALAERVLRERAWRRPAPRRRWQLVAAAAVLTTALAAMIGPQLWEDSGLSMPITAVGPTHPGVSAIAVVVDQQPAYVDEAQGVDLAAMEEALKRLGLTLKKNGVDVAYAGKCYMPDTECQHIVLNTPDGHVSVILMPGSPVGSRALVVDRRLTALVTPVGSGGYVVVAGSQRIAKRTERLFVKG
jgi:hypothetical protein